MNKHKNEYNDTSSPITQQLLQAIISK